MLNLLSAFVLALASLTLLGQHRPQTNWRGSSAAYFVAGLLGLGFALALLILGDRDSALLLMLKQLTLYAALPLLVALQIAALLNLNGSRDIWGRILLGLAATFELCRRFDGLHELLWITLLLGSLALVVLAWRKPAPLRWIQAGFWLGAASIYGSNLFTLPAVSISALCLLAVVDFKRLQRA